MVLGTHSQVSINHYCLNHTDSATIDNTIFGEAEDLTSTQAPTQPKLPVRDDSITGSCPVKLPSDPESRLSEAFPQDVPPLRAFDAVVICFNYSESSIENADAWLDWAKNNISSEVAVYLVGRKAGNFGEASGYGYGENPQAQGSEQPAQVDSKQLEELVSLLQTKHLCFQLLQLKEDYQASLIKDASVMVRLLSQDCKIMREKKEEKKFFYPIPGKEWAFKIIE